MTRSVVTGSKGFIGRHLVAALKARGDDVMEVDLPVYDIRRVESFGASLWGADVVYHLAALPRVQYSIEHPAETEEANVLGTINVLEAARAAGVKRVVFASSSSVYGEQVPPLHEGMTLIPMSPYAHQKAAGEWYCRMFAKDDEGMDTVCLRLFNVYGPGADPNGAYALVVAKFIAQRLRGEPMTITGDGTHTRDFTHVSDAVRAFLLAGDSTERFNDAAINIGGGRQISVSEVARLIGGPVRYIEERDEPPHTLADIRLARHRIGWTPLKPFEDGIAELLAMHQLAPAA